MLIKKSWIMFVLLQVLFTACNSDVFVKAFLEGDQNITLNTCDSVIIPFKDKNWDIEGVFLTAEMRGDIYDVEGNLIQRNTPLRGDKLKGLVKLDVGTDKSYFSFRVERNDWKSLKIVSGPNMNEAPTEIRIWVSNGFDRKQIWLTFNPSERYEVDHIEYHWDRFRQEKEKVRRRELSYGNLSSGTVQWIIQPYERASRYVTVTTEEDNDRFDIRTLFGTPPEVEIFDVVDGKPEPNGICFPLDGAPHSIELPFAENVTDTVQIPPYSIGRVELKIYSEVSVLPYTLYGIQKASGYKKVYEGLIRDINPVRYDITAQSTPVNNDKK